MSEEPSSIPYRQIRAHYNAQTVTVYQAYSIGIASAAVQQQKLNASEKYSPTRMTWIKPSWCWMMYRSGYSLKDSNQARILAIKMTHENFQELLSHAAVTSGDLPLTKEEKEMLVRVQWDPERMPNLGVCPYRSIQIGISGALGTKWVEKWIEVIEDVTEKALELERAVRENPQVTVKELVERGLMPLEREYEVSEGLRQTLKMNQ